MLYRIDAMQTITKRPTQCLPEELESFVTLVRIGGEVEANGLVERVRRAHSLIYLIEEHQLIGIAALKHPDAHYALSVFHKAGSKVNATEYALELGWLYISPSGRGRKLSHLLVQEAIRQANGSGIFATSRADNTPMHKALAAAAFTRQGNEYRSRRGLYTLTLFTLGPNV